MLQRARSKSLEQSRQNGKSAMPRWIEADALCLPFPDQHFSLVTSAFGFRNLADYDAGLREIAARVAARRRVRHSRLQRTQGIDRPSLSPLLQAGSAARRHHAFRRSRPLCLSSQFGRTLSRAAGDAGSHAPSPVFAKPVGRPIPSALPACIAERSESSSREENLFSARALGCTLEWS